MPASFLDESLPREAMDDMSLTRASTDFDEPIPAHDDEEVLIDEREKFAPSSSARGRKLRQFEEASDEVAALYRMYDYAYSLSRKR